ncbi:glycoside hydrolase family 3 N-terminal domain-containing protein [Pseudosporangium ferrugineum]|uniref:beta-N-acetylhexosaminidase n=1 Tax=Pseudosporangium ferrugineum TaxID=439699 RepID=A0A2T0RUB3_9ACTN|nr:glycoside hydrolase family 3 N-terminal domain-containing protein [Pseudosporangium ferrugineum]PRY24785.1 beta-N-acetylhexosaminidase [Pseudosporangium ferrugineum]
MADMSRIAVPAVKRGRLWWGVAGAVAVAACGALTACSPRPPAAEAPPAPASTAAAAPPSRAAPSSPAASSSAPDCVTRTLAGMSVDERAGQVLMIGTPVDTPRRLERAVADRHLGGVFLAGRSTRGAAGLRADLAALRRAGKITPLIALDQEGGSVQTLKGPDFPLLPSAQRLGRGSPAKLRDTVRDSARRLADIGVTVNLAPVADTVPVDIAEANPPIGAFHRQYGSEPGAVAADVGTVVAASQGEGVLTILKHFPGLGRVRANTDVSRDVTDARTTADDPYLQPFVAGMKAGSAGVMMSSARYPRLDRSTIAAFSRPIVTGLLRERLGYSGLIMSDDLGAADAAAFVPVGERAVRFVAAGGDLVLTIRPQDAAPMAAALVAEARRSPSFDTRLTDAARHVLRTKERAGVLSCTS